MADNAVLQPVVDSLLKAAFDLDSMAVEVRGRVRRLEAEVRELHTAVTQLDGKAAYIRNLATNLKHCLEQAPDSEPK